MKPYQNGTVSVLCMCTFALRRTSLHHRALWIFQRKTLFTRKAHKNIFCIKKRSFCRNSTLKRHNTRSILLTVFQFGNHFLILWFGGNGGQKKASNIAHFQIQQLISTWHFIILSSFFFPPASNQRQKNFAFVCQSVDFDKLALFCLFDWCHVEEELMKRFFPFLLSQCFSTGKKNFCISLWHFLYLFPSGFNKTESSWNNWQKKIDFCWSNLGFGRLTSEH